MSDKIRTTIYMLRTIHRKAHALMRHLDYSKNLTVFLEQLIREKWDACGGDSALSKFLEPELASPPKEKQPNTSKRIDESPLPAKSRSAKAKGSFRKSESEFGKG